MFDFKLMNVDARKKEIIDALGLGGNSPIADACVPKQDRVMIADFVIAAVEKAMETIKIHVNATGPLLTSADAYEAYVASIIHELGRTMDGIMHHMATEAMAAVMESNPALAMEQMLKGAFGGAPKVVSVKPGDSIMDIIREHLGEGPLDKEAEKG